MVWPINEEGSLRGAQMRGPNCGESMQRRLTHHANLTHPLGSGFKTAHYRNLPSFSATSRLTRLRSKARGSIKGHGPCYLQDLGVPVGCHPRRNVVGFAVSHEAVYRRVLGSSPT